MPRRSKTARLLSYLERKYCQVPRRPGTTRVYITRTEIAIARPRVYQAVCDAVHSIIQAQDGASTTETVLNYFAYQLTADLRNFTAAVDTVGKSLQARYFGGEFPARRSRFENIIKVLVEGTNLEARSRAETVCFRVRGGFDTEQQLDATLDAIENALKDITRVVADVILAQLKVLVPKESTVLIIMWFTEAVTATACISSRTVANPDCKGPPPAYTPSEEDPPRYRDVPPRRNSTQRS
ncbi:hypothetical protein F4821DRAFT_262766 [Hypoxylon rubiginosum]|uniref:Uncharacterized protein n=1 Tax=Hypoxylon rubiginosum TaxID=110542 RepID=A0ACC0CT65_9PEZI|nr:hypothetical protein F4821DRAFT_262766 [Hypoxylon rubiginosum]